MEKELIGRVLEKAILQKVECLRFYKALIIKE
jgi:hypothetical protein